MTDGPAHECVRCGYCCRKAPCPYGVWDYQKHRCVFLTGDNQCEKYEEILEDPESFVAPAFGYGCCMPLCNPVRDRLIKEGSD